MDEYIRIATIENEVEAAVLDSILTDRGIDHSILNFQSTAFPTVPEMTDGWGVVEGPTESGQEIIEILENLRTHGAEALEENPSEG